MQLRRLALIAGEMGAEYLSADAITLAERASEGRFYVACIGQFKPGESTLLNAFVERAEGAGRVTIEIARVEELRRQVETIQLITRPSTH